MENRKHIIFPLFLTVGFFIFQFNTVFAYHTETHAYLTNEAIDFYNVNFPNNEIPYELRNYLIDGSCREDDAPRWMNHFYDPVYDRGLTYDPKIDPLVNLGNWQKSKDWAWDGDNQNSLTYKVPATIASILTAIQKKKINALTLETDFTWDKAIGFYIEGEKEKAMFILGHILHLIEDTSVPDHTRNDPHPDGSPYEEWTKQFSLNNQDDNLLDLLKDKKPIVLINLGGYFNSLANYSNNNFYSKDTIGIQSGYSLPESINLELINNNYYGVKNDEFGNKYYLFFKQSRNGSFLFINKSDVNLGDVLVKNSYWSRLSPKAIQYAAGVIDLFFKEAEAAKNDPKFLEKEEESFLSKALNSTKGFFSQIGSAIGGFFEKEDNFELVSQISLNKDQGDIQQEMLTDNQLISEEESENKEVQIQIKQQMESEDEKNNEEIYQEEDEENIQKFKDVKDLKDAKENSVEKTQSGELIVQRCNFNVSQLSPRQGVIINEVAWMGTTGSASDEWIELKNISSFNIDLSGWELIDKDEQIKITFSSMEGSKIITPGGFVLLERTDDGSVSNITADLVYSGALSNSNEGLRLFNNQCGLIDEVLADSSWPAGDSSERKTMERDSSGFNWHTSSAINGTPKANNSEPVVYYGGGGGGGTTNTPSQNNNQEENSTSTASSTIFVNPGAILISEIQAGIDGNTEDEFIEFYNPTDSSISLDGWELRKKTSGDTEGNLVDNNSFIGTIPAKGFFLVTNPSYSGSRQADLFYSASSSNIAYSNNEIILYSGDHSSASVIDKVSYESIEKGQSIERRALSGGQCVSASGDGEFLGNGCNTGNISDFEIRATPNPQNSQSLPEPRSAPAASIEDFNVIYSSSTMELVFDWQASTGFNVSTSTLFYEIQEYSSPGKVIFRSSTSTNLKRIINEVGRDHNFSIQVTDVDGLGSAMVSSTINIPSFLNLLSFYNSSSSGDVIEARYRQKHFIPDIFQNPQNNNWRLVVFYLNSEAGKQTDIYGTWQPDDLTNILPVQYENCASGSPLENSLVIPDLADRCGVDGGAYNKSIKFSDLEDDSFAVRVPNLSGNDRFDISDPEENYITVAFYSTHATMPYDGTVPYFRLVAVDKTKYYFGEEPNREAPQLSDYLNLVFDKPSSQLNINWEKATDADTLDSLLTYEIRYSNSTNWTPLIGNATGTIKSVNPGESFSISVRALDDLGNYSSSTTPVNWNYPETVFYLNQAEANTFSNSFGYCVNDVSPCPTPIVFQGFTPETDFSFDTAVLKIKQEQKSDRANLRLSAYPDNGSNKPDFENQLGTALLSGLLGPDGTEELTFSFSPPVPVAADSVYWLVLEVDSYSGFNNDTQWRRNKWQTAISSDNPYGGGISGGAIKQGENYSDFYYSAVADWYMKLGLE